MLTSGIAFCQTASAQPEAYYFQGYWYQGSNAVDGHDPMAPPRTQAELWNCVGAVPDNSSTWVPFSGVFIYDPSTAVDVTGSYITPHFAPEHDYVFPSPNSDSTSLGGVGLATGLTQMNYLTSGGKTFRFQPDASNGGTSDPPSMKVVNNAFQPYGPPSMLPPPYNMTSDYWDSVEFHTSVNTDPKNGPMVRDFDILFIDAFSGGTGPGTKAYSLPGAATDGSNSTPPPSMSTTEFPLATGLNWAVGTDGNGGSISSINHIAFGDANGDGHVNAADFAVLLAHYNQTPGTFQINPGYSDAYTTATDWIGKAIWSQGDFNLDGKVDLNDYKVFLNPGLISPGAPLNFVPGDVNFDGIVNGQDIAAVASHWLQSTINGDANADGLVNGQDIAAIASHWLQSGGGGTGTAVPEPSSYALAAFAATGIALGGRRRREQMARKRYHE